MAVLEGVKPERVFYYFEQLAGIPRPSHHEKAVSDYLVAFAKEHGLEYYQDGLFNVIIIKEASAGYEEREPLILQGHMDMVAERTPDCQKDMEKEGLELYIDGDFVKAKGTTLGADDGIAVAMALAILEDESLRHPRLEFVCTVCEEVGMGGAAGIDVSMLKGHTLLNIDSEGEGSCLASCAGGGLIKISLPLVREDLQGRRTFEIKVSGLKGGHSGMEIDKGRANANMLLARILRGVFSEFSFRLVDFHGGMKDNAIPREAVAVIAVAKENIDRLKETVEQSAESVSRIFASADPDVKVTLRETNEGGRPVLRGMTRKILALILSMPNGVIRMSDDMPGMVETSINLGILSMGDRSFNLSYAPRSSSKTAFKVMCDEMHFIADHAGARYELVNTYPAWEFRRDSALRDKMCRIYKEMFGQDFKVESVHAGVECGLFAGKIEGLDAVAMGPDMFDIHTPQERLSIASTERTYN
ncbi:MAG: aminoacyl-histidine dipeptidase, partial [Lachnospiraceae bacterium]|nr:aminoacyl-histidine dipeptidase [Lachnospiraceae bacterium]